MSELNEPPALVGYCLGGTMTIAAANLAPVERVATIAAPWRFSDYPEDSRKSLLDLWMHARQAAAALKVLPMEVLQAAFWSLDPSRTVSKFAHLSSLDPAGPQARRFIVLEDWANEGEPLPLPAARELIEDFFGADLPGTGGWKVGGKTMTDAVPIPMLHCTAAHDRITPAQSAPSWRGARNRLRSRRNGGRLGARGASRCLVAFPRPGLPLPTLNANDRRNAPVAQLDRALPSEGRGHRFESCRVRHSSKSSYLPAKPAAEPGGLRRRPIC